MWKAEIKQKSLVKDTVVVSVEFTNDKESYVKDYAASNPAALWPNDVIKQKLDQLNKLELAQEQVTVGKNDFSDVPDRDQASDRRLFFDLLKKYERKKKLVDLGLFTAEQMKLDELKTQITESYSEDYL